VPRPASPARSLGDTEVRLGGTIGVSFPRREWREMTASFRPNVGPRLHHRGYCWTRAADCLENLKPGGRWSKAGQELARRGGGGRDHKKSGQGRSPGCLYTRRPPGCDAMSCIPPLF